MFNESSAPFQRIETEKNLCVFGGATFVIDAHACLMRTRGVTGPTDQVHELMLLGFAPGIDQQLLVMEALDHHLRRCQGLIGREYFHCEDGRWVEHVVWASQDDLEASARLEEDPVVAELFRSFDPSTVSYLRGVRVKRDDAQPHRGDEAASL